MPAARVTVECAKIKVEGLLEDHERIEQRLGGTPTQRTVVNAGKEVYQLKVENAVLSEIIGQLSVRLGLEFKWDCAVIDQRGISVDQLITVKVQDASLDELLARASQYGPGVSSRRALGIDLSGRIREARSLIERRDFFTNEIVPGESRYRIENQAVLTIR